MKTWKKLGTGLWLAASLLVFLPAGSGCVAKRGFTFGHWAGTGEKISLTRVYNLNTALLPPRDAKVVVLPPLSQLPDISQQEFKGILTKSLRNHVPVPIFEVDPLGPLSDYVREDNLAPTMGLFDFQEAARLGRLLGASHVLCVRVQNFRLHPPQVLAMYLGLVEASSGKVVARWRPPMTPPSNWW